RAPRRAAGDRLALRTDAAGRRRIPARARESRARSRAADPGRAHRRDPEGSRVRGRRDRAVAARGGHLIVAQKPGLGLMMAGALIAFAGFCIVLVRVFEVPDYGVLLVVGIGLFALGVVRRLTG